MAGACDGWLSRIEAPPEERRRKVIEVYDAEWRTDASKLVRVLGHHDGRRYRQYRGDDPKHPLRPMERFLEDTLVPSNHGKMYAAHAGGRFDLQLVLDTLVEHQANGFQVEGIFTGASAVILRISKGRHSWMFIDSLFSLPRSLAQIGMFLTNDPVLRERLGTDFRKGSADFDGPLEDLIVYNEQDNLVLWTALDQYQDIVLDMGSEISATLASTAMRLFRRQYLKQSIPTFGWLNDQLRAAYFGGKTEVYRYGEVRFPKGQYGRVLDVNSMYPYAMTFPMPGRFIRYDLRIPRSKDVLYIADVTVDVPEDMYLPPLPHLVKPNRESMPGALVFDVGPRRSWICQPELERALEVGCKIQEVHSVALFEPFMDLKGFADDVYARRKEAQAQDRAAGGKDGFHQFVYKQIGTNCYGKFGEGGDKQQLMIHPSPEDLRAAITYHRLGLGRLEKMNPGVHLLTVRRTIQHAHVAIAAFVTSYGRVFLHQHQTRILEGRDQEGRKIRGLIPEIYYSDTDSISTNRSDIETSDALGALKLEKSFLWAWYEAPKLYAMLHQSKPVNTGKLRYKQGHPFAGEWLTLDDMIEAKLAYGGKKVNGAQIVEFFDETCDFAEDLTFDDWQGPPAHPCLGQLDLGIGQYEVRAKGFRGGLHFGQFLSLRAGERVLKTRTVSIKERLRKGEAGLLEVEDPKRVLGRSCPKRRPLPDGTTVPWHASEVDVRTHGGTPPWKRILIRNGTWDPDKDRLRVGSDGAEFLDHDFDDPDEDAA